MVHECLIIPLEERDIKSIDIHSFVIKTFDLGW